MANKIRLDIVTPERIIYSEDVNMVIARATDGDIGVLPGHAPLIAGLDIWPLRVINDEGESRIAVCGGFLEVLPHKVTILADIANLSDEIDVERALAAKGRAEARLKSGEDVDIYRAQASLKRAMARLKTTGRN